MWAKTVGTTCLVYLPVANMSQFVLPPRNLQPLSWTKTGCAVSGPIASFGSPV